MISEGNFTNCSFNMARNAGQKWVEQILRGQLTCQSSKVNSRTLLAEIILHWLFKISRNSQVNSNKYVAISSGLFPIIKKTADQNSVYIILTSPAKQLSPSSHIKVLSADNLALMACKTYWYLSYIKIERLPSSKATWRLEKQ